MSTNLPLNMIQNLTEQLTALVNPNTWFVQDQQKAIASFAQIGFPSAKHEEWRFTSVQSLGKIAFEVKATHTIDLAWIKKQFPLYDQVIPLVFVNGYFQPKFSRALPSGFHWHLLLEEPKDSELAQALQQDNLDIQDGFQDLNISFAHEAYVLKIDSGTISDSLITFLHIQDASIAPIVSLPRIVVNLDKGAKVNLLEAFLCKGQEATLFNGYTQIFVKEAAHVAYYKFLQEGSKSHHIGTTKIKHVAKSTSKTFTLALSGHMLRNNLHIQLHASGCETHLYGLNILKNQDLVDHHTVVDHAMPHCDSSELYKSVVDGQSTVVFNGKIMVRQDAQKTNAYQSSKNILLSPLATAHAKPQLEIFADDVKCSHGSTTGQLDKEALFYLRSRGIGEKQAQSILTKAFAFDVLQSLDHPLLKAHFEQWVDARFDV